MVFVLPIYVSNFLRPLAIRPCSTYSRMCAPHCSIAFALASQTFLMCPFYRGDLNKNHNEQNRSLRVFSSLKLTSLASGLAIHILLNSLSLAHDCYWIFTRKTKDQRSGNRVCKLNCDGHRKPQTRFNILESHTAPSRVLSFLWSIFVWQHMRVRIRDWGEFTAPSIF